MSGEVPPRLALAYIKGLPPGSATFAYLRGGTEYYGWDMNMYMLTNILDAVRENTYVTVAANSGKRKPEAPKPFERPGAKTHTDNKNPKASQFAAMARMAYYAGRKDK